ncbi:amidohydrolase [Novosphingobium sp. BW1]|uniref:amidohydrolase family protein n=1 Tax=Novosphingobium sp. BW1 TaxID=2592621 RepID=UPI0011DEB14F|nr:amidohydrolase family protein [Novosphingobium sp. BW1]TYC90441.1 amidohydrolase family protein [Novosphingobium sp. BW1]
MSAQFPRVDSRGQNHQGLRVLDSHQHFWRLDAPWCVWPDRNWPRLYRDFLPEDLVRQTEDLAFAGSVLVQSQPADEDTDWLLALARDDPAVLAVVGWVDLASPQARARVSDLAGNAKLRGLRPMLQAIPETDWILQDDLHSGLTAMCKHGLRFDALVEPRHLKALMAFAQRWPELAIVIDHGAKPDARGDVPPTWSAQLAELATLPNVWCKLSGLRTQQACGDSVAGLAPYVRHILESFGPRTMWGSDWPVMHHMDASYEGALDDLLALLPELDEAAQARLFEGAAREFYGL